MWHVGKTARPVWGRLHTGWEIRPPGCLGDVCQGVQEHRWGLRADGQGVDGTPQPALVRGGYPGQPPPGFQSCPHGPGAEGEEPVHLLSMFPGPVAPSRGHLRNQGQRTASCLLSRPRTPVRTCSWSYSFLPGGGAPFCLSSHQRGKPWLWGWRTPLFFLTFPRTQGPAVGGQDLFLFIFPFSISPTLQLFSTELCLSLEEEGSEGKKKREVEVGKKTGEKMSGTLQSGWKQRGRGKMGKKPAMMNQMLLTSASWHSHLGS